MPNNFPEMPSELRRFFPQIFWNWWQDFRSYLTSSFFTNNDIVVTKAGSGIILTSPNGSRWRVTVNNSGALVVTSLP